MFKIRTQKEIEDLQAQEDKHSRIQTASGLGFICKYCHKFYPLSKQRMTRVCAQCMIFIINHKEDRQWKGRLKKEKAQKRKEIDKLLKHDFYKDAG